MNGHDTGVWPVRASALPIATRLCAQLGAEVFEAWAHPEISPKAQFRERFTEKARWILIMASGIAMRFLDGLPQDKRIDPAVVVLDEACRFAIPLLSGHEGGANELAYRVANLVGAIPAVTTATEALKPLVIGIGCRKGVSAERIEQAVRHALQARRIDEIREVATIDVKAREPGLLAFCAWHALPLRIFSRDNVAARAWVTQPSAWVRRHIGVDGVCEPCALLASVRGQLLVSKTALEGVAVAIVEDSIEVNRISA